VARYKNVVTSTAKPDRDFGKSGVGPAFRSSITPVS
jgi:hypothetical protein